MNTQAISYVSKLIVLIMAMCLFIGALNIPNVYAADDKEPFEGTSSSFEVSKYLKIDGGQTYLEDESKKQGALEDFIIKLIKLLTYVIGSFALLFIIAGGIVLMVSHGSSNMQQKGKQIILWAAIGLIVAFLSLIIVTFVQSLFYTA
ncbi:pilin [Patescibacteria group bacterium]